MTGPQTEARAISRYIEQHGMILELDTVPGLAKLSDEKGPFVTYADHATALSERDATIAELERQRAHWMGEARRTLKAGQDALDRAERAESSLAEREAEMGEWQPIETAPKDGSNFLVRTHRAGFVVVSHDVDDPMPTDIFPSGHHLLVYDGKNLHSLRGDYPTHWMPLPAAPATRTGGQE